MVQSNHPSKYLVRAYLERRSHDVKPPPSPHEIRRQLGWGLRWCGWPYGSVTRSEA